MAVQGGSTKVLRYLLGKCMPSVKQNAAKIKVTSLEFDEFLTMYFPKYDFYFAHDPQQLCKTGDMVLIQELPERLTRLINHKVVEIVYPLGDITDPITGKKVVMNRYRDMMKEETELFGKLESGFDYDKAPPRGSQVGKRDFSDKPTYIKYHHDPDNEDPYAV